jgi:hypothetical protein
MKAGDSTNRGNAHRHSVGLWESRIGIFDADVFAEVAHVKNHVVFGEGRSVPREVSNGDVFRFVVGIVSAEEEAGAVGVTG